MCSPFFNCFLYLAGFEQHSYMHFKKIELNGVKYFVLQ